MNISLILAIAYITGESCTTNPDNLKVFDNYSYPTIQYTIGAEIEYGIIGFSTIVDTLVIPHDPIAYSPYHATYTTNIFVTKKWIKAGWEHKCGHPVLSYGVEDKIKHYENTDKFYVDVKIVITGGN